MRGKREIGVETLSPGMSRRSRNVSPAMSRKSSVVSWSDSHREHSETNGEDTVMEDGTETHQAEIHEKIKANDKLRKILTDILAKSDRQTEKLSGASFERNRIETEGASGNPAKMD